MRRKAQIQHVFIYILTIVVVGLILLMGYKVIGNTIKQGCEVEHIKFTSQILTLIEKYDAYGSYHTEQLAVPCDYEEICFVDATILGSNTFNSNNALINNSVTAGVHKNIFLVGKTTEPLGFNQKIVLINKNEPLCFKVISKQFRIAFRGDGENTQIEEY
jgi:hypothetical protein